MNNSVSQYLQMETIVPLWQYDKFKGVNCSHASVNKTGCDVAVSSGLPTTVDLAISESL